MKTKNRDEDDANQSLLAGDSSRRCHPFSKTILLQRFLSGLKFICAVTQGSPLRGQPWAE